MGLAETGAEFARSVLAQGGTYIAKVLRGGTEGALLADLKRDFANVRHYKPPSSRSDSAELFLIAMGYRGEDRVAGEIRGAWGVALPACAGFARGDARPCSRNSAVARVRAGKAIMPGGVPCSPRSPI